MKTYKSLAQVYKMAILTLSEVKGYDSDLFYKAKMLNLIEDTWKEVKKEEKDFWADKEDLASNIN